MAEHPAVNIKIRLAKFANEHEQNRNNLRKMLIDELMKEKAGHGNKEDTSKYTYFVEKLISGDKVYLTRPTYLKGFDFIIHVENHKFLNGKDNPSHSDIAEDLKMKKKRSPNEYKKLLEAIQEVFECKDADDMYHKYQSQLEFVDCGLTSELILKVVKWFFIEQDVTFWNYSGRNMFMNGVKNI